MEWWSWLIVGIAIVGAAQAGAVIARLRKAPTQTPEELDLSLTDAARVEIEGPAALVVRRPTKANV